MPRVTPAAPGNSDDAAGTDSNLQNDTTTGGDIVAAIGEMVDRLDKVAVNTARPTYTVKAFGGAGEDVVAWLANFERYARLQNLVGNQCADAFECLPCFGYRRNVVRYIARQSSDGMAGVVGSVSATVCHLTAWAMATRT